ncbi:RNA polymerase sigma-32 factor [Bartonella sp. JB15]|nr:RNA polymerase sigma-32 factor [Bartonella sp. JB15]
MRAKLAQDDNALTKQEIFRTISEKLGVSVSDVEKMDFRFSGTDNSLSLSVSDNGENPISKMDSLVDDHPLPDAVIEQVIDGQRRTKWLYEALKILNERELEIIRFRRLNEEGATLEMLGQKLGISKERVRQIEARALQKLRCALLTVNPAEVYEV